MVRKRDFQSLNPGSIPGTPPTGPEAKGEQIACRAREPGSSPGGSATFEAKYGHV